MDTTFVNAGEIAKSLFTNITESPIELKLLGALKKLGVECITQYKIGPYRADIFIDSKYRKIVVECDGEEFHKDKEKDAKRDEYMRQKGFDVMRFTGSEIHRESELCAQTIITQISEIYGTSKYQDYLEKELKKEVEQDEDLYQEPDLFLN